jgi:CHAT domain-containing protein
LMDAKNTRLIDRFAISNSVSFEYLLRPPARAKPGRSLLSVADPLGQKERRLVVPSNQEYEHLQDALPEAKAVAGMYRGSLLLAGPSAREAEIKRQLPKFTFLHFATHGILDASDNLRSGLLLATEPPDSSEDGVLEAWEILGMSLSARLVFLSACETAQGKERLGDGLLSLAWAFQAAGSPRVVASLWSVDDQATRELATTFYAHLRRGERVDDALRKAMQQTRKNPRSAWPYYWSGFEILGEAGAIQ